MSKVYPSNINLGVTYKVTVESPLDDREVVETYSDLINPNTWGYWNSPMPPFGQWVLFCYLGMRVTVTNDPITDNNGVYYLSNKHYYTNRNNPNLSLAGDWIKIGTNTTMTLDQYTIKNGNDTYLPGDIQQSGVHVVRVDGGEFN